jgi:spore germination protein YaaH
VRFPRLTNPAALLCLTLCAAALPLAGPVSAADAATKPRRIVSGWMPYWGTTDALQALTKNADLYTDVNGFWHSATGSATIKDKLPDDVRAGIVRQAHAAHVPVYGTVTDGTGSNTMASILKSPTKRLAQVRALVNLAVSNHYDGIDLDYEGFAFHDSRSSWANTRPAWVTFIRQLSSSLHKRGIKLAVTTPAIYNAQRADSSGYWVYDWKSIAPYIDRLRIMAYDFSVSHPGPIAPIDWVRQILRFAVTQVPANKIQLGVPAYGRNWVTSSTKGCPSDNMPEATAPTARQAEALASDNKATKHWDATTEERWFTYNKTYVGHTSGGAPATCTVVRKVVYDDAHAVLVRTHLVAQYHLAGIALWALGYDGAGQFAQLNSFGRSVVKRTPVISLFAGDTTYGGQLTVSGRVRSLGGSPAKDLGWRLQWAPGGGMWRTVATGRTSGVGSLKVSRLATSSGSYRLLVSGSWWYAAGASKPNASSVRVGVEAALGGRSVRHGHSIRMSGQVHPSRSGLVVDRQVRHNGKWTTVATGRTSSQGSYAFNVTPPSRATYLYRVVVHGDGHRSTGYSKALRLKAT